MNTHFNWGKIYMQNTFAKVNNSKCPLHVITYDGMWVNLLDFLFNRMFFGDILKSL